MDKEKIKQVIAFILSMLFALSMFYIVYWKAKILFKF